MSVIRIVKDKNFITMGKYHLKEKNMSLKAIGLLSIMLSLPDDWDYSVNGLTAIRKESRNTINEILKELERFGYLTRRKLRNNKGMITEVEYTIYESPYLKNQDMENQDIDNQDIDNCIQLNTKQLNTKEIEEINNKKEIYKESWECDEYVNRLTEAVVEYLNEQTERSYKTNNPKTRTLVKARLRDGFNEIDFLNVIDTKCNDWLETDMEKYLRPETLFGTKFENYANERKRK